MHFIGAFVGILDHGIAGIVDDINIVAGAALQRIGPGLTVQFVIAAIADDDVIGGIARAVDIGAAGQGQILELGDKRMRYRAQHRIGAFARVLDDEESGGVEDIGVVAFAACQLVAAAGAIERIIAVIADDRIVAGIAGTVDIGAAGQGQILDIGAQGIGRRRCDDIKALAGIFDDDVLGAVDDIGIVAFLALQRVVAAGAIQGVIAVVADNDVIEIVACAIDIESRGHIQRQILDIGSQRITEGESGFNQNRIDAFIGVLHHTVELAIDDIGIVASAALQRIAEGAAIQHVIAAIADDGVGIVIAGPVDIGRPGQGQIFKIPVNRKIEGHRTLDQIYAIARFRHDIANGIDDIDVAAIAAVHYIVAGAAIEGIGVESTNDDVVERIPRAAEVCRGASQGQVFEIGAERIAHGAQHRVGAFVRILDDVVRRAVHDIGVIAGPALQRVDTGAAIKRIIAAIAGNDVIAGIAGAVDIRCSGQRQIFDAAHRRKIEGHRTLDKVDARRIGNAVGRAVDDIGIIAGAALQRIDAAAAIQNVVAEAAGDDVVVAVAGEGPIDAAGEGEILDADEIAGLIVNRRQGVGLDHDRIAGIGIALLVDRIQGIGEAIGIVAVAALQQIGSRAADQSIVAGITFDPIVAGTAVEIIVARAADQMVVAAAALDLVVIGAAIDEVVLRPAIQRVVAGTAKNGVVAGAAEQNVVEVEAGNLIVAAKPVISIDDIDAGRIVIVADEDIRIRRADFQAQDNFDIERVQLGIGIAAAGDIVGGAGKKNHIVGAAGIGAGKFIAERIQVIDIVAVATIEKIVARAAQQGIVAGAALQIIVTSAAIQRVIARTAGKRIVAGITGEGPILRSCIDRILNAGIIREIAHDRRHRIVGKQDRIARIALAAFIDDVARAVDGINIVARAAGHDIVASAAGQLVVAGAAQERVIFRPAIERIVAIAAVDQIIAFAARKEIVHFEAENPIVAG